MASDTQPLPPLPWPMRRKGCVCGAGWGWGGGGARCAARRAKGRRCRAIWCVPAALLVQSLVCAGAEGAAARRARRGRQRPWGSVDPPASRPAPPGGARSPPPFLFLLARLPPKTHAARRSRPCAAWQRRCARRGSPLVTRYPGLERRAGRLAGARARARKWQPCTHACIVTWDR